MTGEEDASDGPPRRATRDERPRDDDHPRPARAAERGGPADGGGAPRRVPRLRPGPDRARRRALGRRWDVLRGLRSQGLCRGPAEDRKSTRLNSSHGYISYAVFCLKKKKTTITPFTDV